MSIKPILCFTSVLLAACGPGYSRDDLRVESPESPETQPAVACEETWTRVTESTAPRYFVEMCAGPLSSDDEAYLLRVTQDTAVITDAVTVGCNLYPWAFDVTATTATLSVKIFRESKKASAEKTAICASGQGGIRFIFPSLAAGNYTLRLENYEAADRGVLERNVTIAP